MKKENAKENHNGRYRRLSSREVEREDRQDMGLVRQTFGQKDKDARQEKHMAGGRNQKVMEELFGKKQEPEKNSSMRDAKNGKQRMERAGRTQNGSSAKKEILLDIILDGTYSFTEVFPKVYYMIKSIVEMLDHEAEEYRSFRMKYGLTVLHEQAEPVEFEKNLYFTDQTSLFLEEVRNVEFYGGSMNGRENLTEALDMGLRVLNNAEGSGYRGVILFSDSLPEEKDLRKDFSAYNQDGYINKGLRFAVFYTNTDEFTPSLRMVDRSDNVVENGRNLARFYSLNEILTGDWDTLTGTIKKIVSQTLSQISVR